jgi:hypothetical protein
MNLQVNFCKLIPGHIYSSKNLTESLLYVVKSEQVAMCIQKLLSYLTNTKSLSSFRCLTDTLEPILYYVHGFPCGCSFIQPVNISTLVLHVELVNAPFL